MIFISFIRASKMLLSIKHRRKLVFKRLTWKRASTPSYPCQSVLWRFCPRHNEMLEAIFHRFRVASLVVVVQRQILTFASQTEWKRKQMTMSYATNKMKCDCKSATAKAVSARAILFGMSFTQSGYNSTFINSIIAFDIVFAIVCEDCCCRRRITLKWAKVRTVERELLKMA